MMGMDLSDARLKAEVDWIEVRFRLERSTNFKTLYDRGQSFIKAFSEDDNGLRRVGNTGANTFSVRLQCPGSFADVVKALDKITSGNRIIGTPEIVGLELALDIYSVSGNDNALADRAYNMFQFATKFASDNRRFTGTLGNKDALPIPEHGDEVKNLLNQGRGIFIGNKHDDLHQRIYVKRTDNHNMLPVSGHRARYEVTFKDGRVPVRDLDELQSFKFESLAYWFRFCRPKPAALTGGPFQKYRQMFLTMDTRPGEVRERLTPRGKRKHATSMERDKEFNAKSADALRGLSRRWKGDRAMQKIRLDRESMLLKYKDSGVWS